MEFKLLKGEIEKFVITSYNIPEDISKVIVESRFSIKVNVEEKIIALTHIFGYTNNHEEKLLKIESTLYHEVTESTWENFIQDKKVIIPKGIIQHFGILSIGATRGMLIAKTADTPFSKLIVPPVNIGRILNENVEIDYTTPAN